MTSEATEPRTYSGWRLGLGIVGAVILGVLLFNILTPEPRPPRTPIPTPTVIVVTPG